MSKPNKFTKSIMERLEQEQKQTKIKEEKAKSKIILEPKKAVNKPAKKPAAKKINQLEVGLDIESIIKKPVVRKAKNKTFYLDEIVINTLQKEAKRLNITDSKLANEIFKSVLNIE